jgi:general secretion pathway protein L
VTTKTSFIRRIRAFFRWWRAGLGHLLPAALRGRLYQAADRLLLDIDDDSCSITHVDGRTGAMRAIYRGGAGDESGAECLRIFRDSTQAQAMNIALRIPEKNAILKSVFLPIAAEGNLGEVLAFDMDRQTPFSADRVYFDYRITGRDPGQDRLQVELLVARRDFVDGMLARIQPWGTAPDRVTIRNERAEWNLLPDSRRPAQAPMLSRRTRLLAWAALASLVAVLYVPPAWQTWRTVELERRIEVLRPQAAQARALREEYDLVLSRPRFLAAAQASRVPVLDLLNDLSTVLPDNTWITQLTIRGERLELQGESDTAGAIIELLDRSMYFDDVQFASATTRSNTTQRDRFHVSARIAPGPGT